MIVMLVLAAALRIVSLAPALTEDLYAIGAGNSVVGVDSFSNRPAAARRLPRVGTLRQVDVEAIVALHPTLVIGTAYETRALADASRSGVPVRALSVDNLEGDLAAIRTLGIITGREAEARTVTGGIRAELTSLSLQASKRRRMTGFAVIGRMPIYTAGAGSFIDELMRLANVQNVAHGLDHPWPTYSAERLLVDQPDVLIVTAPSPPLDGMPWSQIAAVRNHRVIRIAEDDLLRPGPHVGEVLRVLVARLAALR